ncbi:UNVERIFIED_CONTAM: tRNA ligase class I (E and Q), catalytic domain-containing protein [Hammondia hammondi]|eukprot:XP_008884451.1 tRNA ligase class I (E and Q), catalytic domain-containing protein [Hammondia hammondi]
MKMSFLFAFLLLGFLLGFPTWVPQIGGPPHSPGETRAVTSQSFFVSEAVRVPSRRFSFWILPLEASVRRSPQRAASFSETRSEPFLSTIFFSLARSPPGVPRVRLPSLCGEGNRGPSVFLGSSVPPVAFRGSSSFPVNKLEASLRRVERREALGFLPARSSRCLSPSFARSRCPWRFASFLPLPSSSSASSRAAPPHSQSRNVPQFREVEEGRCVSSPQGGDATKKGDEETIVTRFAPSPTGPLHVGGARVALFSFLLARQKQTEEERNARDSSAAHAAPSQTASAPSGASPETRPSSLPASFSTSHSSYSSSPSPRPASSSSSVSSSPVRSRSSFLLRIEDTDERRNAHAASFASALLADLRWLGISWDEGPDVGGPTGPYRQSLRSTFYANIGQQLVAAGCLYPCFCSKDELLRRRQEAVAAGERPRYDGTCRSLSAAQLARRLTEARESNAPFTLRFKVPENLAFVEVHDALRGRVHFPVANALSDFLCFRRLEAPVYNFCVALDDWAMGVTHVVRGCDHLINTASQVLLLRALNARVPLYVHSGLLCSPQGAKISKRSMRQFDGASPGPLNKRESEDPGRAQDVEAGREERKGDNGWKTKIRAHPVGALFDLRLAHRGADNPNHSPHTKRTCGTTAGEEEREREQEGEQEEEQPKEEEERDRGEFPVEALFEENGGEQEEADVQAGGDSETQQVSPYTIEGLRRRGFLPEAVLLFLSGAHDRATRLSEVLKSFSIDSVGASNLVYDETLLQHLHFKLIRQAIEERDNCLLSRHLASLLRMGLAEKKLSARQGVTEDTFEAGQRREAADARESDAGALSQSLEEEVALDRKKGGKPLKKETEGDDGTLETLRTKPGQQDADNKEARAREGENGEGGKQERREGSGEDAEGEPGGEEREEEADDEGREAPRTRHRREEAGREEEVAQLLSDLFGESFEESPIDILKNRRRSPCGVRQRSLRDFFLLIACLLLPQHMNPRELVSAVARLMRTALLTERRDERSAPETRHKSEERRSERGQRLAVPQKVLDNLEALKRLARYLLSPDAEHASPSLARAEILHIVRDMAEIEFSSCLVSPSSSLSASASCDSPVAAKGDVSPSASSPFVSLRAPTVSVSVQPRTGTGIIASEKVEREPFVACGRRADETRAQEKGTPQERKELAQKLFDRWIAKSAEACNMSRKLFLYLLRFALTGSEEGPPIRQLVGFLRLAFRFLFQAPDFSSKTDFFACADDSSSHRPKNAQQVIWSSSHVLVQKINCSPN